MVELEVILYSNILAIILALTALIASKRGGGITTRVSGIISLLVFVLIAMACLEIFNPWSDGKTADWVLPVKYITTSLNNFFTVIFPGLCAIFIYDYSFVREKNNKIRVLLILPSFIWIAVLIANFRLGFVFTITEGVYQRGSLVYLTFLMPFVYYVIGVIITFSGYYGRGNFLRFPVWTLAFPALGGATFQAIVFGVSTTNLGVAIGLCGACVSIQKERLYIDELTHLYNRAYLSHVFSQIEKKGSDKPMGAIMLNIDGVKHINAEFGNEEGDRVLMAGAMALEKSMVKGAELIRFAGDEFICLIRRKDIIEALNETLDKIKTNTEAFNNEEHKYKLSFAIGSSILNEGESPDKLLKRIDEKMYFEKAREKARTELIRRGA